MPPTPPPPSTPLRLTLISHALTDAVRHARFPLDEQLLPAAAEALSPSMIEHFDQALSGPETRARQTAAALGLAGSIEPALADLDHGSWAGRAMAELAEGELLPWLTTPAAAPHGGESVQDLIDRIGAWLGGLASLAGSGRIVATTHPAVIRAAVVCALGAPPAAFWRIDITPASRTVLHGRGPRWTLRTTSAPLGG